MTQGERIKEIRKLRGLTLEKFGEKIGMKKNSVSQLENGKNSVTEQVIKSICREFNVNERWLRTGEGEPYLLPTNDIVAKATALLGKHDPLFESIVEVYSKLDEVDKKVLIKVTEDLLETYRSKKE